MAISRVGSTGSAMPTTGSGATTVFLPGTVVTGDIVIIAQNVAYSSALSTSAPVGAVAGSDTTAYSQVGSTQTGTDNNVCVLSTWYKIMPATPDDRVKLQEVANSGSSKAAIIYVFRGVDTTNPFDVTSTGTNGNNSGSPNNGGGPSITPTTSGTWILNCVANATNNGVTGTFTTPTGYAVTAQNESFQATGGTTSDMRMTTGVIAWTSGTHTPGTWTYSSTAGSQSWASILLALREIQATTNYYVILNNPSF